MSGLNVMQRLSAKRVPVDEIGAAEARLSELKARAEAAAERRADAAKRIAEAKAALDAAAEAGEEMAPIAQRALAAEADLKAAELEAGPLAAAVRRAEEVLAGLREERRVGILDAQIEKVHAEAEKVKAEAGAAVKVLAALVERAYGISRLSDALHKERDGKQAGPHAYYEDGMWMTFLEDESRFRPLALAPEDAGKTPAHWSLRIALQLVDPQTMLRVVRHELLTEKH